MPYNSAYTQQHGFMHAGIIATALTVLAVMRPSRSCQQTPRRYRRVQDEFLAPAKGQRFVFRGQVVKLGRTLTVCDAQGLAIDGGSGERLIARITGTLMALFERQDIAQ